MTQNDGNPAPTSESADEKNSGRALAKAERKRDDNGRFLAGNPPGPGRPPTDPTLKALCEARTASDMERCDRMVADPKTDPWLVFEIIKWRQQMRWGKPLSTPLVSGPVLTGPLLSIDMGGGGEVAVSGEPLTASQASQIYLRFAQGGQLTDAEIGALQAAGRRPALEHDLPARAERGEVIDAQVVPAEAPTQVAVPAPSPEPATRPVHCEPSPPPAEPARKTTLTEEDKRILWDGLRR